jgi:hypothetical protein
MYYHSRGVVTSQIAVSKFNDYGVRVYIPLRGQKNGERWVKPISVSGWTVAAKYPLLMSFRSSVTLPLSLTYAEYVMYEPFSMAMLDGYVQKAAAANLQTSWIRKTTPTAPERLAADAAALAAYDAARTYMDHANNASRAFALGLKQPEQITYYGDNMPTVLKSDYEIAIRFKDGGNIVKYVPLEDINDYISSEELADLTTIKAIVGETKTTADFDNKSISDYLYDRVKNASAIEAKFDAISAGEDEIYETYKNKVLIEPVINPSSGEDEYAYIDVPFVGEGYFTIYAKQPGSSGNLHSLTIAAASTPDTEATLTATGDETSGIALVYTLATDSNGDVDATTDQNTGVWFYKRFNENSLCAQFLTMDELNTDEHLLLMAEMTTANFSGGGTGSTEPLTASSAELNSAVAKSPAIGAPTLAQTYDTITYDTNKITFRSNTIGQSEIPITVAASCRLTATLGSETTEITLVGTDGAYKASAEKLGEVFIEQSAVEAPLSVSKTESTITITLPADASNDRIITTMAQVVTAIETEMAAGGCLAGIINDVVPGEAFSGTATAVGTSIQPFTCATAFVEQDGQAITIYLSTAASLDLDNWSDILTDVNADEHNTLITASAGAESASEPFSAITLAGGTDVTPGAAGAIRVDPENIWVTPVASEIDDCNWRRIPHYEPTVTVINDAAADSHYLLSGHNQFVLIRDLSNGETIYDVLLPEATGSLREYRIVNKHATQAFNIVASGTDTIDVDATISLGAYASVVLVDIAPGEWAHF